MTERRGFLARIAGLVGLTVIERGSPEWFSIEILNACNRWWKLKLPVGKYSMTTEIEVVDSEHLYLRAIQIRDAVNAVPNKESENK
mgnify:FL=1